MIVAGVNTYTHTHTDTSPEMRPASTTLFTLSEGRGVPRLMFSYLNAPLACIISDVEL